MFINNKSEGFSLVELLISLIVISCITAAFTPLITKKFSSGIFGGGGSVSDISADCDKFGPNCNLCTSNFCLSCTGLTCNSDEYKDNKSCTCKKCVDTYGADCTKCNEDKCLICPDGQYLNRDDNCVSCTTKFSDCATCNEDQCLSCKDGGMLIDPTSTTPCSAFNCSSPDFIQIGNLCITKKNMGDSTALTIPSGVNVVNAGITCNSTSSIKCCWTGNTSGANCNNENGGEYSGCIRTVCDYNSAETICNNFNAGGLSWRLPLQSEVENWNKYSINLGIHGLQLCDAYSGYSSAQCYGSSYCLGSTFGNCSPYIIWNYDSNGTPSIYMYMLSQNKWKTYEITHSNAGSTRCVATMPQSCAQRISEGCLACDGNTCLSCEDGYLLKNGKCKLFDCSGDDFIQVGNLCVTKKNMGDSDELTIPSGVNIVSAGSTCNSSSTNKCCWSGNTSGTQCDNSDSTNYSGCNRTVCDQYAANYICKNFNYAAKTWRLATLSEMNNWGKASIGKETNGLQFCDGYQGYISNWCNDVSKCSGAKNNNCSPNDVWSSTLNGTNNAYDYGFGQNTQISADNIRTRAFSTRCVTEMPYSCQNKYGAGCVTCNGSQCLACDTDNGYILKNSKCESTFCKGSDFMLIGNLCVTRKNMGDSTTLKIPSGVNVVNVYSTCNSSSSNRCCWQGATSAGACDNVGGSYSGCNRTVCDWWAADYICQNYNYGGKTWRLPIIPEANNWLKYTKGLKDNGLQLCAGLSGYGLSQCAGFDYCPGAYLNSCYAFDIWGGEYNGSSSSYSYQLLGSELGQVNSTSPYAFTVRCVTEL